MFIANKLIATILFKITMKVIINNFLFITHSITNFIIIFIIYFIFFLYEKIKLIY